MLVWCQALDVLNSESVCGNLALLKSKSTAGLSTANGVSNHSHGTSGTIQRRVEASYFLLGVMKCRNGTKDKLENM